MMLVGPLSSKAKVDYFNFTGGGAVDDILRFDIPVDDAQPIEL